MAGRSELTVSIMVSPPTFSTLVVLMFCGWSGLVQVLVESSARKVYATRADRCQTSARDIGPFESDDLVPHHIPQANASNPATAFNCLSHWIGIHLAVEPGHT
jgi:hypothetical protein